MHAHVLSLISFLCVYVCICVTKWTYVYVSARELAKASQCVHV